MKIGEFAKKNNISIDTIRHYIDLGLIVAQKENSQYNFDDSCQQSLTEIFTLKNMGFALNEIKTIFLFKSLGRLTSYQQQEYFRTLYESKYKKISSQIDELTSMRDKLSKEISNLSQYEIKKNFTLGVNVSALAYLKCRKCGSNLTVSDGIIEDNQIMSGTLKCTCTSEYRIENGIIFTDGELSSEIEFTSEYIADYIQDTDSKYLDNIYKGIDYSTNILDINLLKNKVILELGSGMGFLLRNLYSKLPDNSIYFAVDYDINRHIFLKKMLERADKRKNIVFICGDFLHTPIGDKSVDVIFDFTGTSNYSFENTSFLLDEIDPLIKNSAYLLGSYIVFKNFSVNSHIEDKYRRNFTLDNIKTSIANLGYNSIKEDTSNYLSAGGKYEDYFVMGEKVFRYLFFGKRQG